MPAVPPYARKDRTAPSPPSRQTRLLPAKERRRSAQPAGCHARGKGSLTIQACGATKARPSNMPARVRNSAAGVKVTRVRAPLARMSDATPTTSPTILVIDDDAEIRYSLSRVLSSRGYQVVEAASGEQGVELVKAAPPPDL